MISIRKSVFETNSSSTHAICISKEEKNMEIPEEIYIDLEDYEFGWEFDIRTGYRSKLVYILIGILRNEEIVEATEKVKKILSSLKKFGVNKIEIKGFTIKIYGSSQSPYFWIEDGYVDHSNELGEFIEILLADENLLKKYIFDDDSFIATGNDNSDEKVVNKKIEETHEIYWKGN